MTKLFDQLFNEKRRDIFLKRKDIMKTTFRESLEVLEFKDKRNHSAKSIKSFEQVEIGYNGLGTQFLSGVQSKESKRQPSSFTVNDHFFGTQLIGEYVHKVLKKSNYDIDWMVNEWLYDHLFLWAKIKITKEEHHKDNVIRNKHTIEQKLNLEHYKNVSELI